MADGTTETQGRSSEEIRRDIRRTRGEMDETIDELEERLSPGRLVDELWSRARSGGGSGADGIGSFLKDHPVPVALMGLGLGWLAVEQARGDGHPDPGTHAPAPGRRGPYGPDAVHGDGDWEHAGAGEKAKAKASAAADSAKDKAGDLKDAAAEKASAAKAKLEGAAGDAKETLAAKTAQARERASEAASGAKASASDAASTARRRARRGARQAKQGFWALMEESPLAVGAMAFGLGLASGASAPTTEAEDRLMGRTADTLKGEAKRVAKDAAGSAKAVAEDAAEAAKEEAKRQKDAKDTGEPVSRLAEQARDAAGAVAEKAAEAAKERAEREDLTPEGVKQEAEKAAQRTADTAKREAERKT